MSISKIIQRLFGEGFKYRRYTSVDPIGTVEKYFISKDQKAKSIEEFQKKRIEFSQFSKKDNIKEYLDYFNNLGEYEPEADTLLLYHVITTNHEKYWVVVYDPVELFDNPIILWCHKDEDMTE